MKDDLRVYSKHSRQHMNKGDEIGWLLEMENLESDSSNLEIYSVANRKPMQLRKNGRDVAKTRFLSNDPGKCILNKLY